MSLPAAGRLLGQRLTGRVPDRLLLSGGAALSLPRACRPRCRPPRLALAEARAAADPAG